MAQRLTRVERKERTRVELVEAARRIFLRRGFHAASLEEIAEEAGYTKGAVYSNFEGKDELFLAVLDAHFEQRARALTDVVLDEERLQESYRAVARSMVAADEREPRWTPLLLEFWTHASRQGPLRLAVSERRERFLEVIAGLIDELASRHGVEYPIPTKEVARGSAALARGMALERLLNPEAVSADLFEQMHTAYVNGLAGLQADAHPRARARTVS